MSHIAVKISCTETNTPKCLFFGPHAKPHGVRGLSGHYCLRLYPKLGHGKCVMRKIPCACISCISMLDKPYAYKVDAKK